MNQNNSCIFHTGDKTGTISCCSICGMEQAARSQNSFFKITLRQTHSHIRNWIDKKHTTERAKRDRNCIWPFYLSRAKLFSYTQGNHKYVDLEIDLFYLKIHRSTKSFVLISMDFNRFVTATMIARYAYWIYYNFYLIYTFFNIIQSGFPFVHTQSATINKPFVAGGTAKNRDVCWRTSSFVLLGALMHLSHQNITLLT